MDRRTVSVVAGGWSLRELGDPGRARIPGFRIGVNDSCLLAPCDVGLSMDRLWLEHRMARVEHLGKTLWARRTALANIRERPHFVRAFECDHEATEFSDKAGVFNGPNSGHCAFNLAYKMRPKRILLWGFDMNRGPTGEAYYFDAYPWAKRPSGNTSSGNYASWAEGMSSVALQCAKQGIEVLNCSLSSAIAAFPKVDPWTMLT